MSNRIALERAAAVCRVPDDLPSGWDHNEAGTCDPRDASRDFDPNDLTMRREERVATAPMSEVEQHEPIEGPSLRVAAANVSTPVETFPPPLAPDPYARQQVSRRDLLNRAPDTDPYTEWYVAQRRESGRSLSSHRNAAVRPMYPAETSFVPSAAAASSSTDEVAVVRRFLEDAGVLRSDEPMITRTEILHFVKGRMS